MKSRFVREINLENVCVDSYAPGGLAIKDPPVRKLFVTEEILPVILELKNWSENLHATLCQRP